MANSALIPRPATGGTGGASLQRLKYFKPNKPVKTTSMKQRSDSHPLIYPDVTKAGGLQSQGVMGDAVLDYCDPLTTQDLKVSGFPEG